VQVEDESVELVFDELPECALLHKCERLDSQSNTGVMTSKVFLFHWLVRFLFWLILEMNRANQTNLELQHAE
jgi:hypothetical protein